MSWKPVKANPSDHCNNSLITKPFYFDFIFYKLGIFYWSLVRFLLISLSFSRFIYSWSISTRIYSTSKQYFSEVFYKSWITWFKENSRTSLILELAKFKIVSSWSSIAWSWINWTTNFLETTSYTHLIEELSDFKELYLASICF